MAWKEQQVVRQAIDEMMNAGVIRPSRSPWAFPMALAPRKDGTMRFCIDYRKLNQITKKDAYLIPRVDDGIAALKKAKYYTALDLLSGYWQIRMHPDDIEKMAFNTRFGLY